MGLGGGETGEPKKEIPFSLPAKKEALVQGKVCPRAHMKSLGLCPE